MKISKAQLHKTAYAIPDIRFEDQRLTSFSGLVIFQALFKKLDLKSRLKECFTHQKVESLFGHHVIFMLLIVHLLMGFRRLRGRDYYHDDPMVKRVLSLKKIPDVATISRSLKFTDAKSVTKARRLSKDIVLSRLSSEKLLRVTLDFDGSVFSSKKHAEGTATGYNKKKKGARSYYPLFCTVAQTGQFLDFHHRPGNVHDSNGAQDFIENCFAAVSKHHPQIKKESRLDSAFFSDDIVFALDDAKVEFSISVPFERFTELKTMIEDRKRWNKLDERWSYFETDWKPKCWASQFRFVFVRQKTKSQRKGPLQLDIFKPQDTTFDYKVIVTNKTSQAKNVLMFHNGRGTQEGIFGAAKTDVALDYIPTRRLHGNQLYTVAAMIAHNLAKELQMDAFDRDRGTTEKRSPLWIFESLGRLRQHLIHRAGRITKPKGRHTLTLNANETVKTEILHYLHAFQKES